MPKTKKLKSKKILKKKKVLKKSKKKVKIVKKNYIEKKPLQSLNIKQNQQNDVIEIKK